jgi:preprotein translocase subunit SecG
MFVLSITLTLISAVFLILVVLAQNPKGGGLSGTFGGSGGQLIGVKKTSDLLEKMTWGLAIAILVFSLSSSFLLPGSSSQLPTTPNIREAEGQQDIMPFSPFEDQFPSEPAPEGELLLPETEPQPDVE